MALSCYLDQLKDPQVSFAVKQCHPKSVREAVSSTIEMEAYLCKSAASTQSQRISVAAPITKESRCHIRRCCNPILSKRPAWDDATAHSTS